MIYIYNVLTGYYQMLQIIIKKLSAKLFYLKILGNMQYTVELNQKGSKL